MNLWFLLVALTLTFNRTIVELKLYYRAGGEQRTRF